MSCSSLGRRVRAVVIALVLVLAVAPAQAKHTMAVMPNGAAAWPELLRRDPAVIAALGGRRRAIPFRPGGPPRRIDASPAVAAPTAQVSPGATQPVAAPATLPTLAASFLALPDDDTKIPPDTMGAAGPAHLVAMLNTQVRMQSKSGVDLGTVSLATFWTGGTGLSGDPFDPHVVFDALSGRWIASAGANAETSNSQVWLAISATSDPTGLWHFYSFPAGEASGPTVWADFPALGVNSTWIAVTSNMFTVSTTAFQGAKMWVIDKTSALAGGPLTVTVFPTHFDVGAQNVDGFAVKPALTADPGQAKLYLVDSSGWTSGSTLLLRLSEITGTGSAPNWSPTSGGPFPGSGLFAVTTNFSYGQVNAPQLGASGLIDTGDARISDPMLRNGKIWCTHSGGLPATGTVNRTAVFWYQLDPALLPTTGNPIVQSGVLDGGAGVHHFFPSIAANLNNDAAIGFSRSDASRYAEAVYTGRMSGDPAGTLAPIAVAKPGEDSYSKTFSSGAIRWGDYSATSVDPSDNATFWTIQEYAAASVGPTADDDRWGTWWAKLQLGPIGPSPTPTATSAPANTPTATGTATASASRTGTVTATATPTRTATRTSTATTTASATRSRTPTATSTQSATPSRTATSSPLPSPTATVTPPPAVHLDPLAGPILVGGTNTLTGSGFTAGSRILLFVNNGAVQSYGPFVPDSSSPTTLTWLAPASVALGNGFGTVLVVNTDQGFIQSEARSQYLVGAASADIPTILGINGVPLRPLDLGTPVASVETVVSPGSLVTITGTGFNAPLVNLYTGAGYVGPLTPVAGGSPTTIQVAVPLSAATGPGTFQIVNSPFIGNVVSNAVSVVLGAQLDITKITQAGTTITVDGTGFSVTSVVNLWNQQGGGAAYFGGYSAPGQPNVPLTLESSTRFTFTVPTGAVTGLSYLQVVNPPFTPFATSGADPEGSFLLVVTP